MNNQFSREQVLIGADALELLKKSHVAVFGIGGVGSYVAEALVRAGVGSLDFIDKDVVDITNINRQIIALHSTIGKSKTEIMRNRALDINPEAKIETFNVFYSPETADSFDFSKYDYIVDAIDTVTGKLELVINAKKAGTPIISSMGTGNKLDPTLFEVADIYSTSVCPLARIMRKELKSRGVKDLKVVYSKEAPNRFENEGIDPRTPSSISFVPSVAGLIIAGEVIKDIIGGRHFEA